MLFKKIVVVIFLFSVAVGFSQKKKEVMNASMTTTSVYMRPVGSLAGKELIPGKPREGKINPRGTDGNKIVPGKGFPKGTDPLLVRQKNANNVRANKAPSLIFEANSSDRAPSDPTGAVGPNHYVSAKNFDFAIHDRAGQVLVESASLRNIFPGEDLGDPIVFYDSFADRFVITQFDGDLNNPNDPENGFLVAVCKGPDPVNDGWFTYRFNTGTFPDYTKFSIWSDGYYVTANKDQGSLQTSEVVFVIEREKMLAGEENVKIVGFPLPGARVSGFYSTASFNAIGNSLPPDGDARIIYYQDDAWQGVSEDALKLWKIDVDWINPDQSTIAEAEEFTVSSGVINAFDATFDGGSFSNIPQPGTDGQDIDVLQGAIMYATNYRKFCNYNSVVLNFAVDIDDRPDLDNISGIRWYELRQNGDGQPWTVYQEGTYTSPDGKSAWCGSMAMDAFGNIGMGYTTMGTVSNGATEDSFVSIRYTGRLASDALGTMTFAEQEIAVGTDVQRNGGERYGDYAQITVDPNDDQTFWHIAEYFEAVGRNARDVVGVFKIAENTTNDVSVISIDGPTDNTLSTEETIIVTVKNFGSLAQSNIPISYSINGGTSVNEVLAGPLDPEKTISFSFATKADLTSENEYTITAETDLVGDSNPENDCTTTNVFNLPSNDVGIISLISPKSGGGISSMQSINVRIFNFGGTPQSNIPIFYTIDGGERIEEVYAGTLASQESVEYTFETLADLAEFKTYEFVIGTALSNDENLENNGLTALIDRQFCKPTSDCAEFGDGITSFQLANVSNTTINCGSGYEDFTNEFVISLNPSLGPFTVTVQSGFANEEGAERFSLWIDLNDDIVFEASELILDNEIITEIDTDQSFTFSLSNDVPLGEHLLRIRGGDVNFNNGASLNDPCGSMDQGTTHDYTVDVIENPTDTNTGLIVVTEPDNQFLITKVDANAPSEIRIYIYNILGQVVASNIIKKDAGNKFTYELDMSFAKSGIYFARLGGKDDDATGFSVR